MMQAYHVVEKVGSKTDRNTFWRENRFTLKYSMTYYLPKKYFKEAMHTAFFHTNENDSVDITRKLKASCLSSLNRWNYLLL